MLRRRRVARVAAVGVVAHSAGKAGANAAAADPDQIAQTEQPKTDQAAPLEAAPRADDNAEKLTKLKELLDSGVLTQAEFDEQKEKILQTM